MFDQASNSCRTFARHDQSLCSDVGDAAAIRSGGADERRSGLPGFHSSTCTVCGREGNTEDIVAKLNVQWSRH